MRLLLRSLHIENIAVIRTLDLETEGGFTAMTGETGAGKSIVIDSINFLLCNRTGRELVRTGQSRACVSAVFDGIEGKSPQSCLSSASHPKTAKYALKERFPATADRPAASTAERSHRRC